MEIIKKTVLQAVTTGATVPCTLRDPETGELITGCTGTCYILIPDLNAVYNFKISLTAVMEDIGFFDAIEPVVEPEPPIPPIPVETYRYLDGDDASFIDGDGAYFVWDIIL